MIDILLINPISRVHLPAYLSYGILYIASFLREKGYNVKIYDRNADKRKVEDLIGELEPRVVGISVLTGPTIDDAIYLSRSIKSKRKEIPIIWGGIHPTLFPEHVMKIKYVDFVVIGEGEITCLELLQMINSPESYDTIDGLAYRTGNGIKINRPREFINDLDKLPLPAWDLVDMRKYLRTTFYSDMGITYNTSRGCPYQCTYCHNVVISNRKWRGLSAKRMLEGVKHLQSHYGIKAIYFMEDNFDTSKKRVEEFCKGLLENNIKLKFQITSRVNYYQDTSRLELLKKVGCELIEFGVETGSPRLLKLIKKDITVEMIQKAFQNCKKVGIHTSTLFMVGLPTETKEELDMTIKLLDSLPAHYRVGAIFKPYPKTEIFDFCVKEGLFKLPAMNDFGKMFSFDSTDLNVSNIPIDYLKKASPYHFFQQNVLNEFKEVFKSGDIKLILKVLRANFYAVNIKAFILGAFRVLGNSLRK